MRSVLFLTLFLFSSCSKPVPDSPMNKPSPFKSGIDIDGFDITTRPQDDFYQYVNGHWLEKTTMPSDKSNYGSFSIVGDRTEEQLHTIVQELEKNQDAPQGSEAEKVRDFYVAYVAASEKENVDLDALKEEFDRINTIKNSDDFWSTCGFLNHNNVPNIVGSGIYSDMKAPDTTVVYVGYERLSLRDRDYYLKDDARFIKARKALSNYIQSLSQVSNIPLNANAIIEFETQIANLQWTKEESRDPKKRYNPILKAEIEKKKWKSAIFEAGIPVQERYIVMQPSFFQSIDPIIEKTKVETLKQFLTFKVLSKYAALLGKPGFDAWFTFARKELRGVNEPRPTWKRALNAINRGMGEVLGKVYIERFFEKNSSQKMNHMVDNLLTAYGDSIKNLDWMSPETKIQALDKLSKFNPKIAHPKKWKDFTDLAIGPDSAIENQKAVFAFELKKDIEKLNKPVDKSEWSMPPQIVNAYYNGIWNEIVFPAAILQPPFFDVNADDAVNYGGIGAVIGHEIGHGFDDQGRKFDGDGVLRDWWTKEDASRFTALKEKLSSQFNAFEVIDGLHINGEFTSGENIGDLGGLSIAYKAYHSSLEGKEAPVIDGMTGDQRFFMGWAQVWRRIYTEKDLKMRVTRDPHSPSKARVNVILSNIDAFYAAFNIQESDKMYIKPDERVRIW